MPNMATTNTTTTRTSGAAKPARKPAARKSTARTSAARTSAARTSATTTRARSTAASRGAAAKAPSTSTGRRTRTIAKNETRDAASAQAKAARVTAAQGRSVAERAGLVYVGATLEARDRVLGLATGLADRFGSRAVAEREVKKDIRRFERRGNTARNQLERDVRKARTRLERELRSRRRDVGQVRLANVSNRVEDAVATGSRIATVAKERVTALV